MDHGDNIGADRKRLVPSTRPAIVIDAVGLFKTKNSELVEVPVNGANTRFSLGVRSLLAGRYIYGIRIIYASDVTKSPTGANAANQYSNFILKSFLTIQDDKGLVRIKDKPLSGLYSSNLDVFFIDKMKINFEKSYISSSELLTYDNGGVDTPIPNSVALLEFIYE